MSRRRAVQLGILVALVVLSLAVREQAPAVSGGPINLGDTAWLLTATGLVLLMTPGLSFFCQHGELMELDPVRQFGQSA
jgi:Amt family ammonium transporter